MKYYYSVSSVVYYRFSPYLLPYGLLTEQINVVSCGCLNDNNTDCLCLVETDSLTLLTLTLADQTCLLRPPKTFYIVVNSFSTLAHNLSASLLPCFFTRACCEQRRIWTYIFELNQLITTLFRVSCLFSTCVPASSPTITCHVKKPTS